VAQNIASTFSNCELVAIYNDILLEITEEYEQIGFVFSNYAGGSPKMVADFVGKMKLPDQGNT
jgi:hypothetical protein